MKDEKAKYLIINASDITKQLYQVERTAYCNDFENIYHRVDKIDANEIFAKNNVLEEFRKIIIKVSMPVFGKKDAQEYTMGFSFDYNTRTIEERNNRKYLSMHNSPISYDGTIFDDRIVLTTEINYLTLDNVIDFLEEVYKKGCLENYLQSIKEFFDITLDLEILFEAWHQTHNRRKTLKLYKQRTASKII